MEGYKINITLTTGTVVEKLKLLIAIGPGPGAGTRVRSGFYKTLVRALNEALTSELMEGKKVLIENTLLAVRESEGLMHAWDDQTVVKWNGVFEDLLYQGETMIIPDEYSHQVFEIKIREILISKV